GVRIRSDLEYVDPHVVDHADDVFHLFRIGNILRQVVIDLRVSQVTLLTTAADQFFEARLLLRFSGHNTLSTEGLGGQKNKPRIIPELRPHAPVEVGATEETVRLRRSSSWVFSSGLNSPWRDLLSKRSRLRSRWR